MINVTITFPIKKNRYKMYEYLLEDFTSGLMDNEVNSDEIVIREEEDELLHS